MRDHSRDRELDQKIKLYRDQDRDQKIKLYRDQDRDQKIKLYRDQDRDQIKRVTGTWTGTGTKKSWSRTYLLVRLKLF